MSDAPVSKWVRIVLVVAGVPDLLIGLWAVMAPRSFYDDFPGLGPAIVAADGPYNRHLTVDAGAGFLAAAVGLLLAAWFARRIAVVVGCAAFLAFSAPHVLYHLVHPAHSLSGVANLMSTGSLAGALAMVAVALVATMRRPT